MLTSQVLQANQEIPLHQATVSVEKTILCYRFTSHRHSKGYTIYAKPSDGQSQLTALAHVQIVKPFRQQQSKSSKVNKAALPCDQPTNNQQGGSMLTQQMC